MRKTLVLICLFLILFSSEAIFAEDVGEQVRLEIVPQWYTKDKIKIYGQISVRKEFHENDYMRYVVKPSIAYSLSDAWNLRGGLGLLYTDNKDINGINVDNRFEIRPFQGIKYNYAFNEKWNLDVYGRVEERFDYNVQTKDSVNTLRLRLRLRGVYRFNAYQSGKYYRLMFGIEAYKSLSNLTHETDEKYQVSLGLERSFNHNQKGRIDLTWENQDTFYSNGSINYSKVYLRLRYYPTWGTLFNKIRKQD